MINKAGKVHAPLHRLMEAIGCAEKVECLEAHSNFAIGRLLGEVAPPADATARATGHTTVEFGGQFCWKELAIRHTFQVDTIHLHKALSLNYKVQVF